MKNIKKFEQFSIHNEEIDWKKIRNTAMAGAMAVGSIGAHPQNKDIKNIDNVGTEKRELNNFESHLRKILKNQKLQDALKLFSEKLSKNQISELKSSLNKLGIKPDSSFSEIKEIVDNFIEKTDINSLNEEVSFKSLVKDVSAILLIMFAGVSAINLLFFGIPFDEFILKPLLNWRETPNMDPWYDGHKDLSLIISGIILIIAHVVSNNHSEMTEMRKLVDEFVKALEKKYKTGQLRLSDNKKFIIRTLQNRDSYSDSSLLIDIYTNQSDDFVEKIIISHKYTGESSPHDTMEFDVYSKLKEHPKKYSPKEHIRVLQSYLDSSDWRSRKPADKPASIASMTTKPVQPEENKIQPAPAEKQTKPEAKNPQTNRGFLQKPGKIYDWASYSNR